MIPKDWHIEPLQHLLRKPVQYGIVQTGELVSGGVPCVRVVDLTKTTIVGSEMITTSQEINERYKKTILEEGEVLIALRGEIGHVKQVGKDLAGANITRGIARLSPNRSKVTSEFLSIALKSSMTRADLLRRVNGSALQEIPINQLKRIPVPLPPISEQRYIAQILLRWERAEDYADRLIAAKQERRKWFKQQLLMGRHRFQEFTKNWTTHSLGALIVPTQRPVPKPTEAYKAVGIRSHCKGTFERLVDDPSKVDMEELFVVRKGDLIVNITFAWEGAIAFVSEEHDGYLVSHRFPTYCLKEDEINADFLQLVVTDHRFLSQLRLISPGGAGRNRVMSKRDFLDIKISVPCLEEQRKIGQCLKQADVEIRLLRQQLDALREQKKGLMQQLLTGKRRVKLPAEGSERPAKDHL